jgi:hypothetical protein
MNLPDWSIRCDAAVFERIKDDASFQQIIALTRAVNCLQFVLDAFVPDATDLSSKARRSRINSVLFGSAVLYEALLLVEKMNQYFRDNEIFEYRLHTILRDPVARKLRELHMGPPCNSAVFHYDADELDEIVKNGSVHECDFMEGQGTSSRGSYFPFADILAAEVWMRETGSEEEFYLSLGSLMSKTRDLARSFIESSHRLTLSCLRGWDLIASNSIEHRHYYLCWSRVHHLSRSLREVGFQYSKPHGTFTFLVWP